MLTSERTVHLRLPPGTAADAHQTPQWWLYGMSGDLVIARNPNPIVTPKDLPEDLLDVLRLPQPAARLGAVLALRQLMDADPGTALTAYRTLETLAVDDSRRVSARGRRGPVGNPGHGAAVRHRPRRRDGRRRGVRRVPARRGAGPGLPAEGVGPGGAADPAGQSGRGAPGHLAADRAWTDASRWSAPAAAPSFRLAPGSPTLARYPTHRAHEE